MARQSRCLTALLLLFMFVFSLMPQSPADAYVPNTGNELFEPGEKCIDRYDGTKLKVDGEWKAIDQSTGETLGTTTAFYVTDKGEKGNWRNYNNISHGRDWVEAFNGNWDWYNDHVVIDRAIEDSQNNTIYENYIRDIVRKCGGSIPRYDAGSRRCWVNVTEGPMGGIYPASWSVYEGQETTIKINPTSNVVYSAYRGTDWEFYIDGDRVDSGHESRNTTWVEIPYTFPSAGTYELELKVEDGVGRTHQTALSYPVASQPAAPGPPPSGDGTGPVADFDINMERCCWGYRNGDEQFLCWGRPLHSCQRVEHSAHFGR